MFKSRKSGSFQNVQDQVAPVEESFSAFAHRILKVETTSCKQPCPVWHVFVPYKGTGWLVAWIDSTQQIVMIRSFE